MDKKVKDLINEISSKEPVPGGGAVSAFSGSVAVSLCQMVCNLTIGKKRYREYDEETRIKIDNIERLCEVEKQEFLDLFDRDNQAFDRVMQVIRMPKETDEEIKNRKQKLAEAYKGAMEVPLEVARKIENFYQNIIFISEFGNPNCITDVGVASLQAFSALQGAILNVKINLDGIKNEELANKTRTECETLLERVQSKHQEIMARVAQI